MGNFIRVTRAGHVEGRNFFKVTLTFIGVLLGSLLQWLDAMYFKKRQKRYFLQKPPIFVIGHWRSGTTLMHNLLCTDRNAGFVTTYQSVFPNNLRSKWLFKTFMQLLMPRKRPGDNVRLDPDYPQEDEYALSNITTRCFYHFFYFPRHYRKHYAESVRFSNVPHRDYARWKKLYKNLVIRALINTNGGYIVLKNPANTGRIKTLLEIFPTARFIFMHRNPATTYLSSVKFFTNLFPALNLHSFSEQEIKAMVVDNYVRILNDYLQDRHLIPVENLIEVGFEQLQADPLGTVKRIYDYFGLSGLEENRQELGKYVLSQKKHRMHSYQMDAQEAEYVQKRFRFAFETWHYTFPESVVIREHTD
jgi:hypothetical protein